MICTIGYRHVAARGRVLAQRDQHRPSGLHVLLQRVSQTFGQRAGIGEDHECVFRHVGVRSLIRRQRLQGERRLARRFERGFEIKRAGRISIGVHQQGGLWIGAFHREEPVVVLRESVGAVDLHLAARESVGGVEREEFHGGAPVGGNLHLFGFERLAVGEQRDLARRIRPCRSRQLWRRCGPSSYRKRGAALRRSPPSSWGWALQRRSGFPVSCRRRA